MSAAALRKEVAKLRERLGDISAPTLDISDPVSWAEAVSGLKLDEWQKAVLRSDSQRLMLLCSRQSGKSEVVSLVASSIAARGGAVIVVSPSLRQSANLFRRMRGHLQQAGIRFMRETTTEINLAGGGWAVCLPGDRPSLLRGLSLRHAGESALVVDESAYVKDDLWPVASPMLAAAGEGARLIMLTTPSGPIGEFHRAWSDEAYEAERVTVTAMDCPRISEAFLNEERSRLGQLFRQEYLCEFISSTNSVFSADALAAMFAKPVNEPEAIDQAGEAVDWSRLLGTASDDKAVKQRLWSF